MSAFYGLRPMERIRAAHDTRPALSTGTAVVLAFHTITDLRGDPILAQYGMPHDQFGALLDSLSRPRGTFIDFTRLMRALDGKEQLPKRAVLVTLDDGYDDLESDAAPELETRGIPALAFAVAGRVGGTNEWDQPDGARALDLADADALLTLADRGIEIGVHSYTHRALATIDTGELAHEIDGCADQLETLGLPRPVLTLVSLRLVELRRRGRGFPKRLRRGVHG